jgi:Zn-finger nucleic acid-binding protein
MVVSDVTIDVCIEGCGGIWFDDLELKKFDEPLESDGSILLNIERNQKLDIDHSKRLDCPICNDMVMARHFFSVKMAVELDECYKCGGIWLDFGELTIIQNLYETDEEKSIATQKYFEEILGNEIKTMHKKNEEDLIKIRRIVNIFRFICPSYYIPGKQDWGAF